MHSTETQRRLRHIIEDAKNLSTYSSISWDDFYWDLTETEIKRAHDKRRLNVYFTRLRTKPNPYVPYEQPFADFAKAIIRTRASERNVGWQFQRNMATAQQYLYEALLRTNSADPTTLTNQHFQNAISEIANTRAHKTAYGIGALLEEIADFINYHNITDVRISFSNPISHPGKGDGLDEESQEKGLKKMPSLAALKALAQASNDPLGDDERILLRTIDLLVVGNFRIGEALTLPVNCWVEEDHLRQDGRVQTNPQTGEPIRRYGLRYWPEKGGEPIVKWLPDCSVPLAKRAVDDLTKLCAEARRVAVKLEQNPDRLPLPGNHNTNELLDLRQLSEITGLRYPSAVGGFISRVVGVEPAEKRNVATGGGVKYLYRVGDIETSLVKLRGQLVAVRRPDGKSQMLSESLCVVFLNQFHSLKATLRFLPELLPYKRITDALGNDDNSTSIFARRGLTESGGSPMRIKTHAFRHWLNTLADRGGLSDLELALWSGRRDVSQNAAYKHGTVEQRVAWAREMLKDGKLYGEVADVYNGINDPVEKELFLETFVGVAHFTPYGVCVHDFVIDPCRFHLNCLSGCPEYLRTKGDVEERQQLVQLQRFAKKGLEKAKEAMAEGEYGASNWVDFNKRVLANTEAALAVDDDITIADGDVVSVFPNGTMIGQPLAK
jgi:hypothetical protein